jgi:uncharacterized protein (DUF2147 family)
MFVASVASAFSEARGTGLEGTWLTEDGASKIHFERCGVGLCGRLVWLRGPNDPMTAKPLLDKQISDRTKRSRTLLGMVILTKIRPIRPLEWSARAYSAEDFRTHDVTLTLTLPKQLVLKGCALWGFMCRMERWTRVD